LLQIAADSITSNSETHIEKIGSRYHRARGTRECQRVSQKASEDVETKIIYGDSLPLYFVFHESFTVEGIPVRHPHVPHRIMYIDVYTDTYA